MVYCKKCGAPMSDNALECGKCGTPVNSENADSLRKGDLIRQLERYKVLLSEISELNSMIKPAENFPTSLDTTFKKRAFMRFFWPFLVGGVVTGSIVTYISAFSSMTRIQNMVPHSMTKEQASMEASKMVTEMYGGYFLAIVIAIGIIICGVIIAKKKQAAFNQNADFMAQRQKERYEQGIQNDKMIAILKEDLFELRRYEGLVPEDYQTPEFVSQIIDLIRNDKATTVEEAIQLLG